MSEFKRDYELKIRNERNEFIVKPPMKIVFTADRSIFGNLGRMSLQIFGLGESKRNLISKDKEDFNKIVEVELKAGTKDNLDLIYKGTVYVARVEQEGPSTIASLESIDGGYALWNSFTTKTIAAGGSVRDELVKDLERVDKGKVEKDSENKRPKVIIGNTVDEIKKTLKPDETFFIYNGQANIIKIGDAVSKVVPVVSAKTGLMGVPTIDNQQVTFTTKLNPAIKLGELVYLESVIEKRLNGTYVVDTISMSGDWDGAAWDQTITCRKFTGSYVV